MSEHDRDNLDHNTGEIRLDKTGAEIPDPTPIEVPFSGQQPESMEQMFQRFVRHQFSDYAALHGLETFAEADDFDHPEDLDPSTPYETEFDPVIGRDLTPADFMDPEKREWIKNEYLIAERNAVRADLRRDVIDEAYKAYRKSGVQGRAAPADAQNGPEGRPGEPLKPGQQAAAKPVHTT